MQNLYNYLLESVFNADSWNHAGAFDYARAVLNDILAGKDILMINGDNIKGTDFDKEKIEWLLNNLENTSDEEGITELQQAYHGPYKRKIWTHIEKTIYSGKSRKLGGGLEFEQVLCENLKSLVLDDNFEVIEYKKATENFWKKIKDSKTISIIRDKVKAGEDIGSYIQVTGKGSNARNAFGQLINVNTFEVNMSKKINLDNESEDVVTNVLTQSGKIIADLTISTEKNPEARKGDINHVNPLDIYISCKDGAAQQSAISMQQPFYGNNPKTSKTTTLIESYKKGDSYEEFMKHDDISTKAFEKMCEMFNCDAEQIYYYFSIPSNKRKKEKMKNGKSSINNEVISTLLQLQIGGNYWYVNSNGDVVWLDDDIDNNRVKFIASGEGFLDPKQIQIMGKLKTKNGDVNAQLKFRTSMSSAEYPYRLYLVVPQNSHIIQKLYT